MEDSKIQLDLESLHSTQQVQRIKYIPMTSRAVVIKTFLEDQQQLIGKSNNKRKGISKKISQNIENLGKLKNKQTKNNLKNNQIQCLCSKNKQSPTLKSKTKQNTIQQKKIPKQIRSQTSPSSQNASQYQFLSSTNFLLSPQSSQINIIKSPKNDLIKKLESKGARKKKQQIIKNEEIKNCINHSLQKQQEYYSYYNLQIQNFKQNETGKHRKALSYKMSKPPDLNLDDSRCFLKSIFEQ